MAGMPRSRVGGGRTQGTVEFYNGVFGWLIPSTPVNHAAASKHDGKIYLNKKDLEGAAELKKGDRVTFFVYADASGLGAMNCLVKGGPTPTPKAGAGNISGKAGGPQAPKQPAGKPGPPKAAQGVQKTIEKNGPQASAGFLPPSAKSKQGPSPPKAQAPKAQPPKGQPQPPKGQPPKPQPPKTSPPSAKEGAKGAKDSTRDEKAAGKTDDKKDLKTPDRKRVSWKRFQGKVLSFNKKFGWIHSSEEIVHEANQKHKGRLYLASDDVSEEVREKLTPGTQVSFIAYADAQGLGAEQVKLHGGASKVGPATKAAPKAEPAVSKAAPKAAAEKAAGRGGAGKAAGKAQGPTPKNGSVAGVQKTIVKNTSPAPKVAAVKKLTPSPKAGFRGAGASDSLPQFWEEHWSDEYSVSYFWNSKTKESRWARPVK